MQKTKVKKILRISLIAIAALLLLAVAGFYMFRNTILEKAIEKIATKMERDYNTSFTVQQATFKGLSGIEMSGITLVPHNADTLLSISTLNTKVNVSHLLTGSIQLGTLEMKNGYVQFVINKDGKNFSSFLSTGKKETTEEKKEKPEKDYARKAYRILNKALNLVPTDMVLENLTLRMKDMGRSVSVTMEQLRLADEKLESVIRVRENDSLQTWKVNGLADPRKKTADLNFFNTDTTRIRVPYINQRYGIRSGFDSIHVNVENIAMDGRELHVDGYASIADFMVNHPKIASKDVVIDKARFDYRLLFGPDFITLDSASTVQLNKIKVNPYARYSIEEDTTYALKAHIPKMVAQDFIESLPKGLFTNFEGMQTEGSFTYGLDFMYNKNKPNTIVFESNVKKDHFKIIKYGAADLAKLNSEFTYRAIENGQRLRPIVVGPSNPNFTPYEQISPYLRNAVLTSEDPSFFNHRGFINEAFKQSIVKNIKTKQFSRGASTISMQLVKNVFLTREKTLSRKLEEILLVYILENNRIASKERMLEVYFNVIEWGPNVYGIGEASQYYFQKPPVLLTLDESLYLASIVPRPKAFMWRFNNEGKLKDYAVTHDNYIKGLMLRRGLITAEDTIGQSGQINVTGTARTRLNLKEGAGAAQDSTEMDNFFQRLTKKIF